MLAVIFSDNKKYVSPKEQGFTLIELSIVLVIIGLIVGGILVGQDLIRAAEVRAQISQIEKFNTAVNTFRAKFNAIPGDMAVSTASTFGFTVGTSCAGAAGERDGNGLVEGNAAGGLGQVIGETGLFWQDISSAAGGNLIDGTFPNNGAAAAICAANVALTTAIGTTFVGDNMPAAKIGHGAFVYVYTINGYNWWGLSTVTAVAVTTGQLTSSGSIPVIQAYNMDKKVDDGLPTTGNVLAAFVTGSVSATTAATNAASDASTTCYNTTANAYSITFNTGAGGNCGLSFRFN